MNNQFLSMEINSKEDLLKVFDILHDGIVKEDEIVYNKSDRTLDIFIQREYLEDKSAIEIKDVLPFVKKYIYPIVKSHIHLSNINSLIKKTRDRTLKIHTFNECRIKDNKYILFFCEVLEIEIFFSDNKPMGFIKDIEIVKDRKTSSFVLSWRNHNLFGLKERKIKDGYR